MRILSGDVRIEEALDSVFIFIFLLLLYMLEFSVLLPFLIMNTVFYHRPVRIWYSCILPTLWILVLLILWICIAPLLFMILLYVRAFFQIRNHAICHWDFAYMLIIRLMSFDLSVFIIFGCVLDIAYYCWSQPLSLGFWTFVDLCIWLIVLWALHCLLASG